METLRVFGRDLFLRIICITVLLLGATPKSVQAIGVCGTGSWTSGNLEIHHIDIGQGDSALIVGPTGKSLLLDAGETNWNSSAKAQIIGPYVEGVLGCKSLDYVLISHFHLDHIGYVGNGGLWNLVETQGFTVGTTLIRDYNTYLGDTSGTFTNWKAYLEGVGQAKLHPVTVIEGTSQVDLGAGVTFKIVAVDGNGSLLAGDFHSDSNPPSENDYSIGAVLSYGNFDEWLGGDLDGQYEAAFGYSYHDIELSAAPEVGDVDVYKANHHGSSHSSSATFVNELDPEVSIVSLGDGNSYGHPTQETMDRLLATSTVYLTERGNTGTNIGSAIVAGNIVIKTLDGTSYTVNGTPYVATEPTRTDVDGDGYFAEADPNDNDSGAEPSPNGGCGSLYQTCSAASTSCDITAGQVLINEVFPSPLNNGTEWVELYNTTASTLDLGYCYIDDLAGTGSAPVQIPASTLIQPQGFWTLDQIGYFNNGGDDVRFLKEDASTVLDSYSYGSTSNDLARYRLPDGGTWAASPAASATKGQSNTIPFYPIVLSSVRANADPTAATSVGFTVTFSKAVTGVNTGDFSLTTTGISGASVASVSGSGASYTVTVNTGSGDGTIRLNVLDDDTIRDAGNHALGGSGSGNGAFTGGETYTVTKPASVNVYVGGLQQGGYSLNRNENIRPSYAGLNNGPVKVMSMNNVPIVASERVAYSPDGGTTWTSHAELMGLPTNQVSTSYTFPWYNNVDINSQLRFGNVGNANTTVTVTVGGQVKGTYPLGPNQSTRASFNGLNAGPVKVTSSGNVPIIASLRVAYYNGSAWTSFSEMMGLPSSKLTTSYTFPYYNNVDLNTQLRFGNVGNALTTVTVTIAGQVKGSYTLAPNASQRVSYPGLNAGPVKVTSSGNVPIIASMRVAYFDSSISKWTDFSEMMGMPTSSLSTSYSFPVYNNIGLNSQLRFGNVGTANTTVTVTIGGVVKGTYNLAPNASQRVSYPVNSGPVVIQSSGNVPIIASERVAYFNGSAWTSFAEMMGLPKEQLTISYLFPWYNNVDLDTQLRFGVP